VNLPQTVTAAVQISLVPAVAGLTARRASKELNHTIETGLRLGLIIGLPCALGLITLAEPIMKLLYPMQIEIASSTGAILQILGWGVLFLSMYQVTTGILQGLGKQNLPARNLFMGAILKGILSYTLVGIPSLNIRGAALATIGAFACASILNFVSLLKAVEFKPNLKKIFLKPAFDGLIMVVAVKLTYALVNSVLIQKMSVLGAGRMATVAAVAIGGMTFVLMLFVTGTLTEEDMDMMPGGSKLKKLAGKLSFRKAG
jgi:stage V sporulation protein B